MELIHERARELMRCLDTIMAQLHKAEKVQVEEFPISPQEFRIVIILGDQTGLTMTELAEKLNLAMSTMTSVIDRMIEKNLVNRERSEDDRRIVRVFLTDQGKVFYQKIYHHRLQMALTMLSSLSDNDQQLLLSLYKKIQNQVNPGLHSEESRYSG